MKKLAVLALSLFAQVCLAGMALAATVYVNAKNDSGIEDGTPAYPFNTVQEGITVGASGDTILVAPGIYYGALEMKQGVRVVSEQGPEVTIIDGMGSTYGIISPYVLYAKIDISGFTIRNASSLIAPDSRTFYNFVNDCVVDNCILDGGSAGINVGSGTYLKVSRTVFKNMNYAISGWNYPGMVLNNVTIHNVNRAIYQPYPKGSYSLTINNSTISNCSIAIDMPTGKTFYWVPRIAGANNNFWNCATVIRQLPTSSYHTIVNEMTGTTGYDPMFVDASAGNLHLQDNSPLIDAGINIGLPFVGAAPDVGAFESEMVSLPDLTQALIESTQEMPCETFKNAGEQRRAALGNKLMVILGKLNQITDAMSATEKLAIYSECADKLRNDILAKADGFYGGNPKNDWIVTPEEQEGFYPEVLLLVESIEKEIASLPAGN